MPGKVNPVMAEATMMVAARVMGNHTTVTIAGSRGNFELNVMMPVLAHALLESITLLATVARELTDRCIVGIEANEERAKDLLERNPSIATALNPYIGYDAAAVVAKESAKRGVSVRQIVLEKKLLPAKKVDEALDVRAMTEPGLPEGGGGGGGG
jgi:fumarate hydratase class II